MVITESPGPVYILSFGIYLLKALCTPLFNFSIIPITGELEESLTSYRLLLLTWGTSTDAYYSLGPQEKPPG